MQNKVELTGHFGGDLSHSLSAWTSTSRDLNPEKEQRIPGLLKFLVENNHHTPFEKSYLQFLVTCDNASHVHFLKHRISSINGESARYKEFTDDKWYIPKDWPQSIQRELNLHSKRSFHMYHKALTELEDAGFSRERAKESARFFLPYSSQIVLDIAFNFRGFMMFQKLRNDEHAQLEIRNIAQEMLQLVRDTGEFNASLDAFGYTKEG